MLTYEEARNIVAENVIPVSSEKISLTEAAGRISAEDITAKINVPSFDRSPYDGFAFMADDVPGKLRVMQEIRAGDVSHMPLKHGESAKILTGAMIPQGADAVTKYEMPALRCPTSFEAGPNDHVLVKSVSTRTNWA